MWTSFFYTLHFHISTFWGVKLSRRRFAFVMDQQAGMKTLYLNWRRVVERQPEIEATWVPITYYQQGGWIEKMRFMPHGARAVWRSRLQVEQGLGQTPFDAVLFNTY